MTQVGNTAEVDVASSAAEESIHKLGRVNLGLVLKEDHPDPDNLKKGLGLENNWWVHTDIVNCKQLEV